MKESIELTAVFPATPEAIYTSWLDSEAHSNMTGGEAICSSIEGESFSAWDDYITGINVKLNEFEEITQTWRTNQFAETDEDSHLIVRLKPHEDGTELTLIHTNIPEGQKQYTVGWEEHYFKPMQAYFSNK